MNKNKLKAVMVENGDSQRKLAEYLGIALSTLNAKINGKDTEFTQAEIALIKKRYNLNCEKLCEIFFNSKVS